MPENIAHALLAWYDENKRVLPWRDISDPYATWVSETMLQQTRVETVLRYYPRFMQRFPTVQDLAEASVEDVLKLWEGLGYYRRARNLHLGAQQVAAEYGGVIPKDVKQLMTIQGIGAYTAGAIASIAYGKCVPAVDGNVIRVVSRVCGIRENVGIPSVKRQIEQQAASFVPQQRAGDFNQAMMDLGATVCIPGTPDCDRCPLQKVCDAYAQEDMDEIPQLPRKNPPKQLTYDVYIIVDNQNRVLMRQRTETMLQGLWVFPMQEEHHKEKQLPGQIRKQLGLAVSDIQYEGEARHVFTHQVWQMALYTMRTNAMQAPEGWRFITAEEMRRITIPTAMKAAVHAAHQKIG